jgi:diketogulonate reductase-like aldo/keto reductase
MKADHLRDNLAVADLRLDAETLRQIDQLFPPPTRKQALAMT